MKRLFKPLNATKKTFFKNHPKIKLYLLCCWSVVFMLNLSANAKTNNCPDGDPLQWDWLQNLITNNNCVNNLLITHVKQFEYNGNNYWYTYHQTSICELVPSEEHNINYYDTAIVNLLVLLHKIQPLYGGMNTIVTIHLN